MREGWSLLTEVWLPHQAGQWEALCLHNLRLHDVRKDKCQRESLFQDAVKTDSRGCIVQPPHPLLLLCGSFKRCILQWRKTAWEYLWQELCKEEYQLQLTFPSKTLKQLQSPLFLLSQRLNLQCFTAVGWMPTHDRDLPACLQASPQRHTDLSHFDGCFCNH